MKYVGVIGFELGARDVWRSVGGDNREIGGPGLFGELGELGLEELHEEDEGGGGEVEMEVGGRKECREGMKALARGDVRDIFGVLIRRSRSPLQTKEIP